MLKPNVLQVHHGPRRLAHRRALHLPEVSECHFHWWAKVHYGYTCRHWCTVTYSKDLYLRVSEGISTAVLRTPSPCDFLISLMYKLQRSISIFSFHLSETTNYCNCRKPIQLLEQCVSLFWRMRETSKEYVVH